MKYITSPNLSLNRFSQVTNTLYVPFYFTYTPLKLETYLPKDIRSTPVVRITSVTSLALAVMLRLYVVSFEKRKKNRKKIPFLIFILPVMEISRPFYR